MTAPKKVLTKDEIIKQLGFKPEKFRPFTKSELDARMKPSDPRSEEEREIDQLSQEWQATIKSVRPGL